MNTALMAHPVIAESRRRLASYGVLVQWPHLGNEHTEDTTAWWTTVVTACAEAHGRLHNRAGITNEESEAAVYVCRRMPRTWQDLWPQLRHYN